MDTVEEGTLKSIWRTVWVIAVAGLMGAVTLAGPEVVVAQDAVRVWSTSSGQGGGYLGVQVTDVEDEQASDWGMRFPHGAVVAGFLDDGPAADAGMREGDVILTWNGTRVESVAHLQRLAREAPAGRSVELTVLRDGSEETVAVVLGDRAQSSGLSFVMPQGLNGALDVLRDEDIRERLRDVRVFSDEDIRERLRDVRVFSDEDIRERLRDVRVLRDRVREDVERSQSRRERLAGEARAALDVAVSMAFSSGRIGVTMQSLGSQLAEYFGVEGGVLVTEVRDDTPAADAQLQAGDVIVAIGDDEVERPRDVTRALRSLDDEEEVSLRIVRSGIEQTVTLSVPESNDMDEYDFDALMHLEDLQIHLDDLHEHIPDLTEHLLEMDYDMSDLHERLSEEAMFHGLDHEVHLDDSLEKLEDRVHSLVEHLEERRAAKAKASGGGSSDSGRG